MDYDSTDVPLAYDRERRNRPVIESIDVFVFRVAVRAPLHKKSQVPPTSVGWILSSYLHGVASREKTIKVSWWNLRVSADDEVG
jgi:hypothetical protein